MAVLTRGLSWLHTSAANLGGCGRTRPYGQTKARREAVTDGILKRRSGSRAGRACTATASAAVGPQRARVAILGGSGRVGSETARALTKVFDENGGDLEIVIVGRDELHALEVKEKMPELRPAAFRRCDIYGDFDALEDAIRGCNLVINAAGPFQRRENHNPLRAAIENGVAYLDVCDDLEYSQRSKREHHSAAVERGVPAIVCGGIYPGVSNLMAARMVDEVRTQGQRASPSELDSGASGVIDVEKVLYSYFTAGSGGVGTTILATTYLLLGEPVATYVDDRLCEKEPFSSRIVLDFGDRVGLREVFLCNLPEVESTHRYLGVPNVEARFGTDPGLYNAIMSVMSKVLPREFLANQENAKLLASISMPLVKLTDTISGQALAMRVDVKQTNGKVTTGIFSHKRCSVAVGNATAAFASCMLAGRINAGVWFPEERSAFADFDADVGDILHDASRGCRKYVLSQAPWQISSKPRQVGMGMYME